MHILFLGAGFTPEVTALAPYNTDLCKFLAARGHSVRAVVGFPNYPQWRKYDEYRGRFVARENHDGVEVLRVPQYIPANPTPLRRIGYDTTFALSALLGAVRGPRPDVILATCSPLQLGLTAAVLGMRWRTPFVFHIQDLLPEGAVALGMLSNRRAIAAADAMANYVYRRAELITGIGHGFLDALRGRGVGAHKLEFLPNWVDLERIKPASRESEWRRRQAVGPEKFLVMYIGNLGIKQDMSTVVRAAANLAGESDIEFILVGDGNDRPRVESLITQLGLPNVRLLGVQPPEDLPGMAAAADLFVVHQAREVVDMVVPSKLLTYGGAGRPTLLAGVPESEGARLVVESQGGVVVEPEDPEILADAILALRDDRDMLHRMGGNARKYIVKNFAREEVLAKLERLLKDAARRRGREA